MFLKFIKLVRLLHRVLKEKH